MRRGSVLLRLLLRLYPPEFREWYGKSILSFHRERLADAKRNGESLGRAWRRTILDLIRGVSRQSAAACDRALDFESKRDLTE